MRPLLLKMSWWYPFWLPATWETVGRFVTVSFQSNFYLPRHGPSIRHGQGGRHGLHEPTITRKKGWAIAILEGLGHRQSTRVGPLADLKGRSLREKKPSRAIALAMWAWVELTKLEVEKTKWATMLQSVGDQIAINGDYRRTLPRRTGASHFKLKMIGNCTPKK